MAAILIEAPASEPLSLAEAKAYLRVEHDADDALIAALVVAAREAVEQATRRVLITQTWRLAFDRWPRTTRVTVPVAPLRSLVAARVWPPTTRPRTSIFPPLRSTPSPFPARS